MAVTTSFLTQMLERLYATLFNGPHLNCRPHYSRQRIDFSLLSQIDDLLPGEILHALLSQKRQVKVGGKGIRKIESSQNSLLFSKLQAIFEDAKTYTQDTGAHALYIGFPLLSLPKSTISMSIGMNKRILAPIAFIPIQLEVHSGLNPFIQLKCHGEGADLVIPNKSLLSFLEQQTKQQTPTLFMDEEGEDPWKELAELGRYVCQSLQLSEPDFLQELTKKVPLVAIPQNELAKQPLNTIEDHENPEGLLCSAVFGLFPNSNQGLIQDMQLLSQMETLPALVSAFVKAGENLGLPFIENDSINKNEKSIGPTTPVLATDRDFRFKTDMEISPVLIQADPFQEQAIALAHKSQGLVIHGPPGTGKSQTILGIILDHLSKGNRVLLVCDKRTALDVVAHRLDSVGFSDLYALVHDPDRDRGSLYKKLREQLDVLPEMQYAKQAEEQQQALSKELHGLYCGLSDYATLLHDVLPEQGASFHELMGLWLGIKHEREKSRIHDELNENQKQVMAQKLDGVSYPQFQQLIPKLKEILQRADECNWFENRWKEFIGFSLPDFLKTPIQLLQKDFAQLFLLVQRFEETRQLYPENPQLAQEVLMDSVFKKRNIPFLLEIDWLTQGEERTCIADNVTELIKCVPQKTRKYFFRFDGEKTEEIRQQFSQITSWIQSIQKDSLQPELLAIYGKRFSLEDITKEILFLTNYVEITDAWYQFLSFDKKRKAKQVLEKFQLSLSKENAKQIKDFLSGLQVRLFVWNSYQKLGIFPQDGDAFTWDEPKLLHDIELVQIFEQYSKLLAFSGMIEKTPSLSPIKSILQDAVVQEEIEPHLFVSLQKAKPFSLAAAALQKALLQSSLFSKEAVHFFEFEMIQGKSILHVFSQLEQQFSSIENILRIQEMRTALPENVADAVSVLMESSSSSQQKLLQIEEEVLSCILQMHLTKHPLLLSWDEKHLQHQFDHFQQVREKRRQALCQVTYQRWKKQQQDRLLSTTGTRLNGLATELRRRLALRGEKALRLRQVIHSGQNIPEGDPLFDLCPIWMASPETVAQIFPREPYFDVVIFDEASQCRLEEALPVLLRGKRVVIAGDSKQLPPSRFFETSVDLETSDHIETEQDLFEQQQSQTEDLLSAALNIEMEQCYLNVHYRSRREELMAFSNEHFYQSQLQCLPGQPNQQKASAISLIPVEGIYEKRGNIKEAQKVCELVQELLCKENPPSIGIACFNLNQRDLILQALTKAATLNPDFAACLEQAKTRQGAGSFEGLFVKNLENVQGDERDHFIISTTYGPDQNGKFYRRFGPLGQSGGGRRLNVLVTRAREAIHIITSIPKELYQVRPVLPPEMQPSGVYLLFAYLHQAYKLAQQGIQQNSSQRALSSSLFVHELAEDVAQKKQCEVFFGNAGFCVDLALSKESNSLTEKSNWLAVFCDFHRFHKAPNFILWEAFRSQFFQSSGWDIYRVWTPHFYRDPEGQLKKLYQKVG